MKEKKLLKGFVTRIVKWNVNEALRIFNGNMKEGRNGKVSAKSNDFKLFWFFLPGCQNSKRYLANFKIQFKEKKEFFFLSKFSALKSTTTAAERE
jgi:hypothetical protein